MADNPSELRIVLEDGGDNTTGGNEVRVDLGKELKGLSDAVTKGAKKVEEAAAKSGKTKEEGTTPSGKKGGGGKKPPVDPPAPPASPDPEDDFSKELIRIAESIVLSQEAVKEANDSLRDSLSGLDLDIKGQIDSSAELKEAVMGLTTALSEMLSSQLSRNLGPESPASTGLGNLSADSPEFDQAVLDEFSEGLKGLMEDFQAVSEVIENFGKNQPPDPELTGRGRLYGLTSGARTASGAAGSVASAAATQAASKATTAAVGAAAKGAASLGLGALATALSGPIGAAVATGLAAAAGGAFGNLVSEMISSIGGFAQDISKDLKAVNATVAMQQAINDFNNLTDAIDRGNDVGEETAAAMQVGNDFTLASKALGTELFRIFAPSLLTGIALLTVVLRMLSLVLYPLGLLIDVVGQILAYLLVNATLIKYLIPPKWLNTILAALKGEPTADEVNAIRKFMEAEDERMADIAKGAGFNP
jgi:hypothetical protein